MTSAAGESSTTPACHLRQVAAAGHRGDLGVARAALGDDDPALRSLALGAMERLAVLGTADLVRAMGDPSAKVRRRAVELSLHHLEVDPSPALDDEDPLVVEAGAFVLGERSDSAPLAALCRVAAGHSDPLCREAAVAALGAIGDPEGLDYVLGALGDKPAVRRRAVIALAAFEGERVEQALHAALEDRDWQVRQAAEDLIAEPG